MPKVLNITFCKIFAISQKRREGWSWFLQADKHHTFYNLMQSIKGGWASHGQSTQNNKFCQIFAIFLEINERWSWFLVQIKFSTSWYHQYLMIWWVWLVMPKVFKITMQYFKKKMSDEVHFLHADKHQSFLQVDTISFDGFDSHAQITLTCLQYLCSVSKKEARNILIFGMCIDLLAMGIVFFICQSKAVTND